LNKIRLINRIKNKLRWFFEDHTWFLFRYFIKGKIKNQNNAFTIGITTFMDRYENCLKPLVEKIAVLFPDNQIIVFTNGHIKEQENIEYLIKIRSFCYKFKNVELISLNKPMGLSFIWNQIISKANAEKVLLLNDDVKITHTFLKWFSESEIQEMEIATINTSWSHFIISKDIVKNVGVFDEGLLEIGGEDDDYSARLAMNEIDLQNFKTNTIKAKLKPKDKKLTVNSYGRNMNEEIHGYSTYNTHYLVDKWQMSNEYFEGAIDVPNRMMRYWKLRTNNDKNKQI
jgi:hypothetical protein